tara:strand:+ start:749 stop:1141 length:393 start_codon:yes stop_codon:yes gene_type:complete
MTRQEWVSKVSDIEYGSNSSGRSEENYKITSKYPTQEEIIDYNRKENSNYSASIDGPGELIDSEMVDHPTHYGGENNPYEAIKVIEEWGLGFNLGNVIKYISRVGKKLDTLEDLEKASWYINREINKIKK